MSTEIINESDVEIDVEHVAKLARYLLEELRVHPQADLRIKFGDEATITELNERYFDTEGPTDVLSFPGDELLPGRLDEEPEEGDLGDIIIAPTIAAKQGETAGHGLVGEIDLLTTHGVLHLLGYDHLDPEEHAEMFELQARLLRGFGSAAHPPS
ncbi:MAG: rRNA maturation RNase YbeY [Nocardioides sp.]|nr:rRNA maturation RNase YbeY [Nocardioides sp.]